MHATMLVRAANAALVAVVFAATELRAQDAPDTAFVSPVTAQDSGPKTMRNGWIAGHKDHTWQEQLVRLSSDVISYQIKYRACVDASHAGVRAFDEGYIGMPGPTAANWYHTGFFHIEINGEQLGIHPLTDMRVTESGGRGAFHMVWDTPHYVARLQFVLAPGADHLLSQLRWQPKPGHTVDLVKVRLTCYPSFFTAARNRQGDRTLITPRTSVHETAGVKLVPAQDTYLLYTDTVFDVANGEGAGPCAMLFLPEQIAAGSVRVASYPVQTMLEAASDTHRLRFAFWDFTGKTNAEAQSRLTEHAVNVREALAQATFSAEALVDFDPVAAQADIEKLLTNARADGQRMRAEISSLLRQLGQLKTSAEQGQWEAEAEFAELHPRYDALTWKLRIFALLNTP